MPVENKENPTPEGQVSSNESSSSSDEKEGALFSFLFTFFALLVVWFVLSGKFDPFHISLGVASCLIVTLFSGKQFLPPQKIGPLVKVWGRFLRYVPWLIFQIFLANIHVMYLVFHPRMMGLIDPQIIRFKSKLSDEMSLFIFANSITLTPGTITVYVNIDGDYAVHAIDRQCALSLPGEMEERVSQIIG